MAFGVQAWIGALGISGICYIMHTGAWTPTVMWSVLSELGDGSRIMREKRILWTSHTHHFTHYSPCVSWGNSVIRQAKSGDLRDIGTHGSPTWLSSEWISDVQDDRGHQAGVCRRCVRELVGFAELVGVWQ